MTVKSTSRPSRVKSSSSLCTTSCPSISSTMRSLRPSICSSRWVLVCRWCVGFVSPSHRTVEPPNGCGFAASQTEQIMTLKGSGLVTPDNLAAVSLYMLQCADYLPDREEEEHMLEVVYQLFLQHQQFPDALRVALRLNDTTKALEVLEACEDVVVKKQMGYMLARHHTAIVEEDDEDFAEILGNLTLSERFASLAKELDVVAPKTPEQIYKSHLSETGTTAREDSKAPESARGNLASSFVNAFVNAGYCKDSLITPDDSKWVYKHKDHGMISAAAAYGMVVMWSVDNITDMDDLLEDKNDNIKAGAVCHLLCCGATVPRFGSRRTWDVLFRVCDSCLEWAWRVPASARSWSLP